MYHDARIHERQNNTYSYNRHDDLKSQPSTYSDSNLWTSKAVAWTVLEMWGGWALQMSGEVGRTMGKVLDVVGGEFF